MAKKTRLEVENEALRQRVAQLEDTPEKRMIQQLQELAELQLTDEGKLKDIQQQRSKLFVAGSLPAESKEEADKLLEEKWTLEKRLQDYLRLTALVRDGKGLVTLIELRKQLAAEVENRQTAFSQASPQLARRE